MAYNGAEQNVKYSFNKTYRQRQTTSNLLKKIFMARSSKEKQTICTIRNKLPVGSRYSVAGLSTNASIGTTPASQRQLTPTSKSVGYSRILSLPLFYHNAVDANRVMAKIQSMTVEEVKNYSDIEAQSDVEREYLKQMLAIIEQDELVAPDFLTFEDGVTRNSFPTQSENIPQIFASNTTINGIDYKADTCPLRIMTIIAMNTEFKDFYGIDKEGVGGLMDNMGVKKVFIMSNEAWQDFYETNLIYLANNDWGMKMVHVDGYDHKFMKVQDVLFVTLPKEFLDTVTSTQALANGRPLWVKNTATKLLNKAQGLRIGETGASPSGKVTTQGMHVAYFINPNAIEMATVSQFDFGGKVDWFKDPARSREWTGLILASLEGKRIFNNLVQKIYFTPRDVTVTLHA